MLTLNQILKRIKTVALSHAQVRNYQYGRPTDFLTEKEISYPSVFLQDNDGSISIIQKTKTFNFKLYVVDLVNVSEETLQNLQDVWSDCVEIAQDLIALLDDDQFYDWALSSEISIEFLFEKFDDMVGGVVLDISIRVPFSKDICAAPLN